MSQRKGVIVMGWGEALSWKVAPCAIFSSHCAVHIGVEFYEAINRKLLFRNSCNEKGLVLRDFGWRQLLHYLIF